MAKEEFAQEDSSPVSVRARIWSAGLMYKDQHSSTGRQRQAGPELTIQPAQLTWIARQGGTQRLSSSREPFTDTPRDSCAVCSRSCQVDVCFPALLWLFTHGSHQGI